MLPGSRSEKAARVGYPKAQYNLAVAYLTGQGVPKDAVKGRQWLRKAAEQGFADAQAVLAEMYFKGEGVLEDYVEAYAWALHAAMNGKPRAKDLLAEILIPSQIAVAQIRAKELQKESKNTDRALIF